MPEIALPHGGWEPRWYQRPMWRYLQNGGRRAVGIWHRRAGKDDVMLHHGACSSAERIGNYWHCLPEYAQARKAIWTAVNANTGKRRIDEAFPPEIRAQTNDNEMFIRFKWGSTWQVIGSDRFDNLVGTGPVGVTFSEFALANPSAWGFIRPMLEENGGWAAFITTPRGDNHAKAMLDHAQRTPGWFGEVLNIHQTGALTVEQQVEALAEYQALYGLDFGRALYEQEYECSFSGAMVGAYFGAEIAKAEREERMKPLEIDPRFPVHSVMDLGKSVNNPIWFFQSTHLGLRIVDFYRPESEDLAEWCAWMNERGYHGHDYVPHDIMVTEWGSSRTRFDTMKLHGRKPKRIAKVSVADGLQAGRSAINSAVFHANAGESDERTGRVEFGISGLKSYRREWDDDLKTFRENPVKDWSEHIGSSWRYLGLAWREVRIELTNEPPPSHEALTVRPDGTVVSNMTLREQIEAHIRKRKARP